MSINLTAISEQAKRHAQKGRYHKAIEIWNGYLSEVAEAEAGNVLNNIGDLLLKSKDTLAAIDHFVQASQAFDKAGFPLKSIATLKKVLKIEPERTEIHLRLGELNASRDMVGNAVESYLTVARLMAHQEQDEQALELIRKVCILDPVNIRHRLKLAAELLAMGYTDKSMEETINAVDLYLNQGNLEQAERHCRTLLERDPDFAPARERLAAVADSNPHNGQSNGWGDSELESLFAELDGVETDGHGLPTDGEHSPAPVELSDMLESNAFGFDAPQPEGATDRLSSSGFESLSSQLRQAAFKHLDNGDLPAALGTFDQFVTESVAQGQYQEADAALRAYLAVDPENPEGHAIRLRIYAGRDSDIEAEILQRLTDLWRDLDPDAAETYSNRLAQMGSEPNVGGEPNAELSLDAEAPETDAPVDAQETETAFEMILEDNAQEPASANADHMSIGWDDGDTADAMQVDAPETQEDDMSAFLINLPGDHNPAPEASTLDSDIQLDGRSEFTLDIDAGSEPDSPTATSNGGFMLKPEATDTGVFEISLNAGDGGAIELDAAQDTSLMDLAVEAAAHSDTPLESAIDATPTPMPEAITPPKAVPPVEAAFDVAEALAEARFYGQQHLTAEAIHAYRMVLTHQPDNTQAIDALKQLGVAPEPLQTAPTEPVNITQEALPETPDAEQSNGFSPLAWETKSTPSATPTPAAELENAAPEDEFLDFTSSIQETLDKELSGNHWRNVSEDAQMDEILTAFRQGIDNQVDADDSETHYDLGLAYREMGLTEEAVGEFQIAIKGVLRHADACIALAGCFAELGRDHLAIGHLRRALERSDCGPDQWVALTYELASALEQSGEANEAKQMYEEVYARDIRFRDVAQRLTNLG